MDKPPPRGTRVAIYARTPGTNQSGQAEGVSAAVDDQVMLCRLFAQAHGWNVVSVHMDAAQSGTGTGEGLRQMLRDAAKRLFDVVLLRDLSRFGRRSLLVHQVVDELAVHGIKVGMVSPPSVMCADCQIQSTDPAKEA